MLWHARRIRMSWRISPSWSDATSDSDLPLQIILRTVSYPPRISTEQNGFECSSVVIDTNFSTEEVLYCPEEALSIFNPFRDLRGVVLQCSMSGFSIKYSRDTM